VNELESDWKIVCSPVSMVTRSNAFPLLEVKTPSFVALSRIGPKTLQGPHQLGKLIRSTYVWGFSPHGWKTRTRRKNLQ